MYLRNLMRELGFMQEESTLIWEDNRAAIALAENKVSSAGRSKHINLRFRFVAEAVKDGIVRVCYAPTDTNHADLFTKSLTTVTFERLLKMAVGLKGTTGSQGYTTYTSLWTRSSSCCLVSKSDDWLWTQSEVGGVLRCVNNIGIIHQHLGISSLKRVDNGDVKVTCRVEKTSDSVEVEGWLKNKDIDGCAMWDNMAGL
jgi:hypothetical protein